MIGGMLLLGVLGAFVLEGAKRGSFADRLSTYKSEPDGARALYLLAEETWHLPVNHNQHSFEAIDEKQNLVLLAVDLSELSEKEEEAIKKKNPFLKADGGFNDDEQHDDSEENKGHYRAVEVDAKEREQLLAHIRGGA